MYDVTLNDYIVDGSVFVKDFREAWTTKTQKRPTWNFGPFLNDRRAPGSANCKLHCLYADKGREAFYYVLTSTKKIKKGRELFWSYGKAYWDAYDEGRIE